MPSNDLILCWPLLFPPSIFPNIRVFSNESALCIRWPKYWSYFSFSLSPSNEYSGVISFRMDWFDFLAVQGTLKSLLQHHRSLDLPIFLLTESAGFYLGSLPAYHSLKLTARSREVIELTFCLECSLPLRDHFLLWLVPSLLKVGISSILVLVVFIRSVNLVPVTLFWLDVVISGICFLNIFIKFLWDFTSVLE